MSLSKARFVFMTCRPGAESAVKGEVARVEPSWRFSFSRPGLLTFKHASEQPLDDCKLAERNWTFAHAHGISLGRLQGESLDSLAADLWRKEAVAELTQRGIDDLHVWQLEGPPVDNEANIPWQTPLAQEIESALRDAAPDACAKLREKPAGHRHASLRAARVLDAIVVAPGEWWIGHHRAARRHQRWPGGAIPVRLPDDAVSRAYAKIEEAIQWSGLPLTAGDECVEIGCAPGGASQALLERGLFVTGIDPADVDPAIATHPRFRHLKKRGKDVRRNEFEGVRWLVADMNIAPDATFDEVESIVTHPGIAIRGMILTLKFSAWKLADRLPELTSRVHGWGYREVRTRQLTTGGQEVCLVALRRKALWRLGRKRRRKQRQSAQPQERADAPHPTLPGPHF